MLSVYLVYTAFSHILLADIMYTVILLLQGPTISLQDRLCTMDVTAILLDQTSPYAI